MIEISCSWQPSGEPLMDAFMVVRHNLVESLASRYLSTEVLGRSTSEVYLGEVEEDPTDENHVLTIRGSVDELADLLEALALRDLTGFYVRTSTAAERDEVLEILEEAEYLWYGMGPEGEVGLPVRVHKDAGKPEEGAGNGNGAHPDGG